MTKDLSTTAVPGFTIRRGTEADIPLLLGFIRAIAEFEKLGHTVAATEESLRDSLFGENPAGEVAFGMVDGEAVAFVDYFYTFSTFTGKRGLWLDDLYVNPEHRGKGYGTAFLAWLARTAVDNGCARFEWTVLDWNTRAQAVYIKIGAESLDDWRINRLSDDALKELAGKADS